MRRKVMPTSRSISCRCRLRATCLGRGGFQFRAGFDVELKFRQPALVRGSASSPRNGATLRSRITYDQGRAGPSASGLVGAAPALLVPDFHRHRVERPTVDRRRRHRVVLVFDTCAVPSRC